ncbi:MAG: phosphate acyltransferase PlsX [Anaerolineae bacterium]
MPIVVDAMGGDNAPGAVVDGAVMGARSAGRPIILVGREEVVRAELARHDLSDVDVTVVHAEGVIDMHELSPASAVRTMPDSSIARGLELVHDGEAEAFVTAGHTGATAAGATMRLGRIKGVRRPALATQFPTAKGPCVMIDVGANTEVKPEYLVQFAVMGSSYAELVLGVEDPTVGLVTIGEERGKGSPAVRAALPMLEATSLNFVGNIEGRDIPIGTTDVAVLDGFTGNVLLKFAEGAGILVQGILRDSLASDPLGVIGALLLRGSLTRARSQMDYRSTGGAVLLGVRGVVVIGHGRSDAEAIKTAVEVAARGVDNGLVEAIREGVAEARAAEIAAHPG